jgi:rhodanese-related sulfurtransferase
MKERPMSRITTAAIAILLLATMQNRPVLAQEPKTDKPVKQIDIEQFDQMRSQKDTVVLDVRTAQEYKQGHVPGSVNLDISDSRFRQKVAELDKSKNYLVHCARGVRSARATKIMSPMGFTHLFDYHGGFDEWKKSGKPVEKPAPEH